MNGGLNHAVVVVLRFIGMWLPSVIFGKIALAITLLTLILR
jgi:hypothetical protein